MTSLIKRLRFHSESKNAFKKYLTNATFKEAKNKKEAGDNKHIQIPKGETIIEESSFWSNMNLKSMIISDGIKSISNHSIHTCHNLVNVIIPKGVNNIGYWAFCVCNNLKNIVIPDTITNIERNAFSNCKKLESIVIPKNFEYRMKMIFEYVDLSKVSIKYT